MFVSLRPRSLRSDRDARVQPPRARAAPRARRERSAAPAARRAAPPRRARARRRCAAADALPAASDLPPERRAIQVVAGDEERVRSTPTRRGRAGSPSSICPTAWAPVVLGRRRLPRRFHRAWPPIAATATASRSRRANATTSSSTASRPRCRCCGAASWRTRRARARARSTPTCCSPSIEIRTWGADDRAEGAGQASRARGSASRPRARRPACDDLQTLAERRRAQRPRRRRSTCASRPSALAFAEVEKRLVCEGLLDAAQAQGRAPTTPRCARRCWTSSRSTSIMDQADIKRADAGGAGAAAAGERLPRARAACWPSGRCTPAGSSRTAAWASRCRIRRRADVPGRRRRAPSRPRLWRARRATRR